MAANFRSNYYQKIGFKEAEVSAEELLQLDAEVVDIQRIARCMLRSSVECHGQDRLKLWSLLLGTTPTCRSAQQIVQGQMETRYRDLKATCLSLWPQEGPLDLAQLPWPNSPSGSQDTASEVSLEILESIEAAAVQSVKLTSRLAVCMYRLRQKALPGEEDPTAVDTQAEEAVANEFLLLTESECQGFWLLTSFLQLMEAQSAVRFALVVARRRSKRHTVWPPQIDSSRPLLMDSRLPCCLLIIPLRHSRTRVLQQGRFLVVRCPRTAVPFAVFLPR